MTRNGSMSKPLIFFIPAAIRFRVFSASGFFRSKMFSPFSAQSIISRAGRHGLTVRTWKHRGLRRGRLLPAVGRQRPSRSSLTGGNNKQAFACCCVAIVGAAKYAFLHPIAERAQRLKESLVGFTHFGLQRLAVCAQWAPANKFGHVLNDDVVDIQFLRPLNHTPSGDTLLILNWPAAASDRVERAFRGGHQKVQA